MKKFGTRIMAAIMAVSIAVSQLPLSQVFAAETSEEKQTQMTQQEEEGKESIETAELDNEKGATQQIDLADIDSEKTDEAQQDESILLNYVFVEKSYVTTPDVQNVMASIGIDSTVVETGVLQYRNAETGELFENTATTIVGNTVLFTIQHQEEKSAIYELVGIKYTINGVEYIANFADIGMNMKYGVNKEVETAPDDVIISGEEEGSEIEANIVTTDEAGQVLSEQDIQQALENSESEIPVTQALDETLSSSRKLANGNLVVVLDPGHDSTHAGTHQNGCSEEDMVLKIAQYCKAELEKYSGVTVYLTREGKKCPYGASSVTSAGCNAARVEFAASKNANVYVSFHLNSSSNTNANGAGIYYPNANYRPDLGQEGHGLAQKILEKLNAVGLGTWAGGTLIRNSGDNTTYPDGSLSDYLGVIRRCKLQGIPAVLIEHAFVTNNGDKNNFLISDDKLQRLGIADATAIAEYYGLSVDNGTTYNGINYSAVYDFDYYINKYNDIKSAYGSNPAAALQHFVNYGMAEGRQAKSDFNVNTYKNRYVDLRNEYGNNLKEYYLHYVNCGMAEGRSGAGTATLTGRVTKLNGVDYTTVYNFDYYISKYEDIKGSFAGDDIATLQHFVNYGMAEGRQAKSDFNVNTYKNRYVDLRNEYGNNLKEYYLHYVNYGMAEGRSGAGTATLTGRVTKLNGVDYTTVYNFDYYISKYEDIKGSFAGDDIAALQHFVNYGMAEGRQAIESFQVQSYYNKYSDLRRTYGNDLKSYYLHYINYGKKEGRIATGVTSMQDCQTVYNGIDYSAVYNYSYYVSKYSDIKSIYGINDYAALKHFVEYGMGEKRQGASEFEVQSYYNMYQDLRRTFGLNWKSYYLHYIQNGKREGRVATGVTTIQNPLTVYQGVDYSAVYDYNYYISHYEDMKKAYSEDDIGALEHFVIFGMSEGRQGSAEFNVSCYRSNYADLDGSFGNNLKAYYVHYINYGKNEGRTADKQLYTNVMGNSQTSVRQMMTYYNANASYPSFYSSSDAPNLQTFCQIYYEECKAEGVRAEVAFAQAMKETGFLKYGGDVKIGQYNFAGLGATGNGNPGNSFSSVREGVRAQVQHLKAYASTEPLKNTCVDPRFKYVTRGTAPYVEWLGIQENPYGKGWATDKNYGYNLKARIGKLLTY